MIKRWFGLLLCGALLLALFPAAALATPSALDGDFTWSPQSPRAGEEIQFTGPDAMGGEMVASLYWDFGDSTPHVSGQNPTHTYLSPGHYRVTYTARLNNATEWKMEKDITVAKAKPVLTIQNDEKLICTYGKGPIIIWGPFGAGSSASCTLRIPSLGDFSDTALLSNDNRRGTLLTADKLLALSPGDHPILGEIAGDDNNERFAGQIGTLTIRKTEPRAGMDAAANRFVYAAGACNDNRTPVYRSPVYKGYVGGPGEKIAKTSLTCDGVTLTSATGMLTNEMDDWGFGYLTDDPETLNRFRPGVYDLIYESTESAHNSAVREKVGELTFTGVKGVTVTPAAAAVLPGSLSEPFDAAVETVGDGVSREVMWRVSGNTSPQTRVVAQGDGCRLQVGADETAPELTLTATSAHQNGVQGAVEGTAVVTTGVVTGVTVDPPFATVKKGGTQQFTAAVAAAGNIGRGVVWSVDGTDSAIDQNGLLTVGAGERNEQLLVTATAAADSGVKGYAEVTVDVSGGPTALRAGEDGHWVFNGDYDTLKALRLDGVDLDIRPQSATQANLGYPGYEGQAGTAEKGSVEVALYSDFLATLPAGVHRLEAVFENDGRETAGALEFTLVKEAPPTPEKGDGVATGDPSRPLAVTGMAALAGAVLLAGRKRRR